MILINSIDLQLFAEEKTEKATPKKEKRSQAKGPGVSKHRV